MTLKDGLAFWGGPVGFVLALALLPGGEVHQGALAGTAWWMLWWWIGGAVPLGPPSLLPLALFPVFGVMDLSATAAPFGSRFIWLFLGGFVLALALERHGLHRRFALHLLHRLGGGPRRTLLGFMLATALLSMWISNTATTLMMLPMATAVLGLLEEREGRLPAVVLLLVYALLVAVHRLPEGGGSGGSREVVQRELQALSSMGTAEKRVMVLFLGTALLWMFRRPLNVWLAQWELALNDTSVAVVAAIACFALPAGGDQDKTQRLLEARDLGRLPWDILLLFGGGLALAKGFEAAGWAGRLADGAAGLGWSAEAMLILVTAIGLFATELMSNLALTLLLTPVAGILAIGMGVHPLYFAAPVALASSGAFMLPMATPPNAIVFSSGRIRMAEMARVGLLLNLVTLAAILLLWMTLAPAEWR